MSAAPDHVYRLRTRWNDADANGVLNNAVVLTLFEEARRALCEEAGLFETPDVFPFLLASTRVDYLRPGRGGVAVDVELTTTRLGTSSFEQSYRVLPADGGEPWAVGEATLVCIDAASGKSRPMSPVFRAALGEDASG